MFDKKNKYENIFFYKIYKNIRNSINKEIILILYSSGIDSNKLKIIIIKMIGKKNIIIIYVNHKINKLDYNYKNYCIKNIKRKKIKLYILNINKKKFFKIKEKVLRNKREKIIKIFNKKYQINSLWNAQQKNDYKETNFIKCIKNYRKKIFYKNFFFYIEKKKPFKNIKKIIIKKYINKFWLEDLNNLKLKVIRNILRIKILNMIKNIKRDVAERFKALPC